MYKGKEVCQGCKVSGDIKFRYEKNNLCEDCKTTFNIGCAVRKEQLTEYTFVRDWVNGFCEIGEEKIKLDEFANNILRVLDNPKAKTKDFFDVKRAQPFGAVNQRIPSVLVEPLNDFFKGLDNEIFRIKKIKEIAEVEACKAVSVEKNRIFNEGVEKGRELLFNLNNGDLTMDDFNKKITKY